MQIRNSKENFIQQNIYKTKFYFRPERDWTILYETIGKKLTADTQANADRIL